jgi:hypothetical protein
LSNFKIDEKLGFYLQKAFVKDWVDNSILFLEVETFKRILIQFKKKLTTKYTKVKPAKIVHND